MTTSLQTYAQTRTQDAFRALINQYIHLVYCACLRQLRDAHRAEDATQAVFILLHQRAHSLPPDRISSWLLTTARYTCANIRKTERRRARREQVAAMPDIVSPPEPIPSDQEILRLLDDALAGISATDREAIALHYLQNQPYVAVGAALGLSEEAARKRVDRALQKLRSNFSRRGIATSAAALATLLPAQAHAATLTASLATSLGDTILHACLSGAPSPALAIAKGTKIMMLAHTAKPIAAAALAAAVLLTAGWWQLARSTTAQPATALPIAALIPASQPVSLDLSTPIDTLASYAAAIKAGNASATAAACVGGDTPHSPTASDAVLTYMLAQNRLIHSAAQTFKTNGEEARQSPTVDQILEQVVAFDRATHQSPTIDGNSATLPFLLPEAQIKAFPDAIQSQVRAFVDHPIRFAREGNAWKLTHAPDNASIAKIMLLDDNKQPVNDPALEILVVQEYAAIYDQIATGLASAKYPTWDQADAALNTEKEQLHKGHHLSDISIQFTPNTSQP